MIGFSTAFAQNTTVPNTILVTGKSEISVKPDEALVLIHVQKKSMKATDAAAMLNKKSQEIEQLVKKAELSDYKLTTSNYNLSVNRIYQKGTSKDSGYVASQNIKISLKDPEKDLVSLVDQLNNEDEITYNVSFIISEEMQKAYEKQLLTAALNNAKEKAEHIASTMELKRIQVFNVNYGSSQPDFPRPVQMEYMRMQKDMAESAPPSFYPEEQKLTDEVYVTFVFYH